MLSFAALCFFFFLFFFNDTATTEIYTLSLHDALPISWPFMSVKASPTFWARPERWRRSEEHTSELQSADHLVCRLLLEKKKNNIINPIDHLKNVFCLSRHNSYVRC